RLRPLVQRLRVQPVARPLPADHRPGSHAAHRRPRPARARAGPRADSAGHTGPDDHGRIPRVGREEVAPMSRIVSGTAAKVVALIAVIAIVVVAVWFFTARTKSVIAYFESSRGIYEDDTVRVLGVRVGTISEITTEDWQSKVTM